MLASAEPPMTLDDLKSRIQQTGRTYEQWKEAVGFRKECRWKNCSKSITPNK